MTMPLREFWAFCLHVLIGGIIFCLIAGLTLAISLLTRWLEPQGMPAFTLVTLRSLTYLLLAADGLTYGWFVVVVSWRFLRRAGGEPGRGN
jgi:cation transporter-like permease